MTEYFRDNLYKYIAKHIVECGNCPSFAQMTAALNISPRSKSLISRNLRMLEKEGRITLQKQGRSLQIALTAKELPLLGKISAGSPIEAIAQQESLDLNALFQGGDRFALQVKGTSMIDEGILDGDMIICLKAITAREGDIVVALIDQQNTTLKRISYKVKNMITLIPANPELKPRAYAPERVQVQGIYIGLVRMNR